MYWLLQTVTEPDNPVLTFFAAFGGIGAASWAIDAALFKFWQQKWGDPTNPTKVLVSLFTPFVLVLGVYFAGIGFGQWPMDNNTLWQALVAAASGLAGAKAIFGVTTAAEKSRPTGDGA